MKFTSKLRAGIAAAALVVGAWALPLASTPANAQATDLFISEYIEGSSNNKALEIYNPTGSAIDLSQYRVAVYANGGTNPSGGNITLEGTLAPGEVFVLAKNNAGQVILDQADQVTGSGLWNGNDAIVLFNGETVVDSFGQVGTDDDFGTNVTLRRTAQPDTTTTDAFDASVQWQSFPTDTFDGLGSHAYDGPTATPTGTASPTATPTSSPSPTATPTSTPTAPGDVIAIGAVQGEGDGSPMQGQTVTVQGVVTADHRTTGYNGFFIQDGGDDNPATSDGLFVYAPNNTDDLAIGDEVRIQGRVSEYYGLTQVSLSSLTIVPDTEISPAAIEITPAEITLPVADLGVFEAHEGMLVTVPQDLAILEYYNYGRYGEIAVGTDRQFQPTALHAPGSPEAVALAEQNLLSRVTLDDGRNTQNPSPAYLPTGEEFTLDNAFRGGDLVESPTGVLSFGFDLYRIHPVDPAGGTVEGRKTGDIQSVNVRPESAPEVGGSLQVGSFNVLNYFTTLNSRGATTDEELARQQAKIVTAINKADAAVVGLNEIENSENSEALLTLVDALNEAAGEEKWAAIETGALGTDEITTAFIYQPALVAPVGDFDVLDDDPNFDISRHRPALAQTFEELSSGETVTVAVNHLKSKGSECNEPNEGADGVGNCNQTRTEGAQALADWLADGAEVEASDNVLIIGDLNSYDYESPITTLEAAGYTDLIKQFQGDQAYSYVFDGQLGYLDHALANEALQPKVTGAADWHINSDEASLIDYSMEFKQDAEDALFDESEFRSSDHDPVLVGLQLVPAPTTPAPSPDPTSPAPTSPAPTSPAPTSPAPTSPAPTSPAPTSPAPTSPAPTSPAPTSPAPTSPAPTSPAPT
ncbi:ExeM/NucH family extracellular endonuclease, partial [Parenemella sanctibonifatiensis]